MFVSVKGHCGDSYRLEIEIKLTSYERYCKSENDEISFLNNEMSLNHFLKMILSFISSTQFLIVIRYFKTTFFFLYGKCWATTFSTFLHAFPFFSFTELN